MSVNDPFVMAAWGQSQNADAIQMVADPGAELTKAMGLDIDLSGPGLGVRSERFAAVVDNGVVTDLAVVASPPAHTVSSAESVLERL